ncbi:MAG: hypothetical protein DRO15_01905 [Thermoprotei archaeon]|nr:MAG: hypothetical protein DRO15_01905 [Thermoprotei archaeon]
MAEKFCISDEAKKFYIPTYESLRKLALKIYVEPTKVPKSIYKQGKERISIMRYLIKCERIYSLLAGNLGRVARLPKTNTMPKFYAEIIRLSVGDYYDETIAKAVKSVKILTKLWREYRKIILASSTKYEAKRYAQEFVGRALSVTKRALRYANRASEAIKLLKESPCIDESLPIIIVAGMPQVGKSTLVSKVSTAKPEISPFPFTTKKVILGHGTINTTYYQVIDTPGILDRPFNEMNQIERKAIAVLRSLSAPIIFLIDPTSDSYYALDSQIAVLKDVMTIRDIRYILPTINKMDKAHENELRKAKNTIKSLGFQEVFIISALKSVGVWNLIRKAIELSFEMRKFT